MTISQATAGCDIYYMILDLKMLYNSYISNKKNNNMFITSWARILFDEVFGTVMSIKTLVLLAWTFSLFNNLQHSRF